MSPGFTEEDILAYFKIPASTAGSLELKSTTQNHGPIGIPNKLEIARTKQAVFIDRKPLPQKLKACKFILCAYDIRQTNGKLWELDFIQLLLHCGEVYLWPGNQKPFSRCTQFTSVSEVLDNLSSMVPSDEETVFGSLAAQDISGLALTDFRVIDQKNYKAFLKFICNTKHTKLTDLPIYQDYFLKTTYLDLSLHDLNNPNERFLLQHAANSKHLEYVIVLAPTIEEINWLKSIFPNLKKIIVYDQHTPPSWQAAYPQLQADKLISNQPGEMEDKYTPDPNRLDIARDYTFEFSRNKKNLLLNKKSPVNVLSNFLQLTHLHITEEFHGKLTVPKELRLEQLTLAAQPLPALSEQYKYLRKLVLEQYTNLQQFGQLEKLTFLKININTMSRYSISSSKINALPAPEAEQTHQLVLDQFPNLETLDLNLPFKLTTLDLSNLPKLVSLTVKKSTLLHLETLKKLTTLRLTDCEEKVLNLSALSCLKEAAITGGVIEKLLANSMRDLTHLSIGFDSHLDHLEVIHCKKLRSLILKRHRFGHLKLEDLENLEELEVSEAMLTKLNIGQFKRLRKLTINALTTKEFKPDLPELEVLIIDWVKGTTLNFSGLKNLRFLELIEYDSRSKKGTKLDLTPLQKLVSLRLKKCSLHEIHAAGLPALKFVGFDEVTSEKINLNASNLTSLSIKGTIHWSKAIDVTDCVALRYFEMNVKSFQGTILGLTSCLALRVANLDIADAKPYYPQLPKSCLYKEPGQAVSLESKGSVITETETKSDITVELVESQFDEELDRANNLNSLSILQDNESDAVQAVTGKLKIHRAKGTITLNVYAGNAAQIQRREYHFWTKDRVTYDENSKGVCFSQDESQWLELEDNTTCCSLGHSSNALKQANNFENYLKESRKLQEDPKNRLGFMSIVNMRPERTYPFLIPPKDLPKNPKWYGNLSPHLILVQHRVTKKLGVKWTSSKPPATVTVFYPFSENTPLAKTVTHNYLVEQTGLNTLLPLELITQIDAEIARQKHAEAIHVCSRCGAPDQHSIICSGCHKSPEPALRFMFNKKHPKIINDPVEIQETLQNLRLFCSGFKDEGVSNPKLRGLPLLFMCINEQRGACAERSNIFVILAKYIGIPAQLIENEMHCFSSVPVSNERVNSEDIDLGGGAMSDQTPLQVREQAEAKAIENLSANEDKTTKDKYQEQLKQIQKTRAETKTANPNNWQREYKYRDHILKLVETQEIASIIPLLNIENSLSILIELTSDQDPILARRRIIQQIQAVSAFANKPRIFIYELADFDRYLKSVRLLDPKKDSATSGPLARMLEGKSSGGIVVVNWSHPSFDAKTRLFYLQKINTPQIQVIGLKKSDTEVCNAFMSRNRFYRLGPHFFEEHLETKTATKLVPLKESKTGELSLTENRELPQIDLFGRENFQEHLLYEDTQIQGHSITAQEGMLTKAIKAKTPLTVYNLHKKSPQFTVLQENVRYDHQILFEGELLSVPPEFDIRLEEKPHADTSPYVKVNYLDSEEKLSSDACCYLGMHNIHEFAEKLLVNTKDKTGRSAKGSGYLYGDITIYYVVEIISRSDWWLILDTIEQINATLIKNSGKPKEFEFNFGPNAFIADVSEEKAKPPIVVTKPSAAITFSNDPDFYTLQLKAAYEHEAKANHKVHIVNISELTSLADLLEKIEIVPEAGKSEKLNFHYFEQGVLTALKNGDTVILNCDGAVSPSLFKQLQSFFAKKPFYDLYKETKDGRGERVYFRPGQLQLVLPRSAQENLPVYIFKNHDYNLEDYRKTYMDPADKECFDRVVQFYGLAKLLPHQGSSMPAEIPCSYALLKNMLRALRDPQPIHKHNPIKGLLHFNYDLESEEYAYLNVIAKYCFYKDIVKNTSDKLQVRFTKLKQLTGKLRSPQEYQQHIWKILNCFHNHTLVEFFGNEFVKDLTLGNKLPQLNAQNLEKLIQLVNAYQQAPQEEKAKPINYKADKCVRALSKLNEDKETTLVFLKGPAGVGKTTTLDTLKEDKQNQYSEGFAGVTTFFSSKGNSILGLDEINTFPIGETSFLKAVAQKQNEVYHDAQFVPLDPDRRLKVFATGNQETQSGRIYLPVLQNYATTICFTLPSDDSLNKALVAILPQPTFAEYRKRILQVFHFVRTMNPLFVYSPRDTQSLAQRFCYMLNNNRDALTKEQLLFKASIIEFAGDFSLADQREAFINKLSTLWKIPYPKAKTGVELLVPDDKSPGGFKKIYVPSPYADMIEGIRQNIQLAKSANPAYFYKRVTLIEGPPGIGKSTIYEAFYYEAGYRKNPKPGELKYEIYSASEDISTKLKVACANGTGIVLDELNFKNNKKLQALIQDLATTKDAAPGFCILASQNSSLELGRENVATAQLNRCHVHYMFPPDSAALQEVAAYKRVIGPASYISGFEQAKEKSPLVNTRTFFHSLEQLSPEDIEPIVEPAAAKVPENPAQTSCCVIL